MRLSTQQAHDTVEHIAKAYRATRARRGADWPLLDGQDDALAAFTAAGFPTTRLEDWKYTNLRSLAKRSAELLRQDDRAADAGAVDTLLATLPLDADDSVLVFVNGCFSAERSTRTDTMPAGISASVLSAGTHDDIDRLSAALTAPAEPQFPFVALNSAFLDDGLLLGIGAQAENPTINVVFVNDGPEAAIQTRLEIRAAPGARAQIVEHHVSAGSAWTNAVTRIHCQKGAQIDYVKLQAESDTADHIAVQHVELAADSRFRALHADLGAHLARNDLNVRMNGPGSDAELLGIFLVDGERHADNHTQLDHLAGHTRSRESYRGILADRGRGVFNGKILVHSGADGTDAQLDNRNLLLSRTAEINTKPELEIYTDEVKCAHGATTGRLDEDALFYLRSRGIAPDDARHLLVLAFALEILERAKPAGEGIARFINQALERRLPE